jgi:hypothetical protein
VELREDDVGFEEQMKFVGMLAMVSAVIWRRRWDDTWRTHFNFGRCRGAVSGCDCMFLSEMFMMMRVFGLNENKVWIFGPQRYPSKRLMNPLMQTLLAAT